MKTTHWIAVMCGMVLSAGHVSGQPISLNVAPSARQVVAGERITVMITIAGLGEETAPSLGAFDLDFTFDPSLLSCITATFGDPVLGDQLDVRAAQDNPQLVTHDDGVLHLFELSLDTPEDLQALQAGAFILATITCEALASGTSPFTLHVNGLVDEFGEALPAEVARVLQCSAGDVGCLIAAITRANAADDPTTIRLEAGTYTLTAVHNTTAFGPNGLPSIIGAITLTGAGADTTVIERAAGAPPFRIVHIAATGALELADLTIRGGNPDGFFGGGLFNAGAVLISGSTLFGNTAGSGGGVENRGTMDIVSSTISHNALSIQGGSGGGIDNTGMLSITDSTLFGNTGSAGGGILNDARFGPGTVTITGSTLSSNTAFAGGGIENIEGFVTIRNSTLSGNTAENAGSGIVNSQGTITVNNSTITLNTASDVGVAGFDNLSEGTVNISNTIIAQNLGRDCRGTFQSRGFNLIGNNHGCSGFGAEGDQVGTPGRPIDVMLGPLQDHGGPTQTHALQRGSPAIDAGNPAEVGIGENVCELRDQRGFVRPIDGDRPRDGTAICDIGAFEFGPDLVNHLVAFDRLESTFQTLLDPGVCNAVAVDSTFIGRFIFFATLANDSHDALSSLQVEITELTHRNALQTPLIDAPPGRISLAEVGSRVAIPIAGSFSEILSPGEVVNVGFSICLKVIAPFRFLVDVIGVVE